MTVQRIGSETIWKTAAVVCCVAMLGLTGCGDKDNSETAQTAQSAATAPTAEASADTEPDDAVKENRTESGTEETGTSTTTSSKSGESTEQLRSLQPATKDDVHIEYKQYLDADQNLTLEITEGLDAVKRVSFLLYLEEGITEDGANEFIYLGEDNNLVGDYNTGKFHDNTSGYWASIDDTLVTLNLIEDGDGYNIYSVPCIIDGQETSIRAMYTHDTGSYKILGRYDGIDGDGNSQMTSRGVRKIDNGAQVVFTLASFEGEDLDEYEYQMEPVTWSDDIVMEDTDLGDCTYLFMYEIVDVFGNEIDVDPVELEIEGDNIYWLTDLDTEEDSR